MESPVRSFRCAFAREHARRVFTVTSIGVYTARVWIRAREVLLAQEAQQLTPVFVVRRRYLWNFLVAQTFAVVIARDLPPAHRVSVLIRFHPGFARRPLPQQLNRLWR